MINKKLKEETKNWFINHPREIKDSLVINARTRK
jgi:hypothetical protein